MQNESSFSFNISNWPKIIIQPDSPTKNQPSSASISFIVLPGVFLIDIQNTPTFETAQLFPNAQQVVFHVSFPKLACLLCRGECCWLQNSSFNEQTQSQTAVFKTKTQLSRFFSSQQHSPRHNKPVSKWGVEMAQKKRKG